MRNSEVKNLPVQILRSKSGGHNFFGQEFRVQILDKKVKNLEAVKKQCCDIRVKCDVILVLDFLILRSKFVVKKFLDKKWGYES